MPRSSRMSSSCRIVAPLADGSLVRVVGKGRPSMLVSEKNSAGGAGSAGEWQAATSDSTAAASERRLMDIGLRHGVANWGSGLIIPNLGGLGHRHNGLWPRIL